MNGFLKIDHGARYPGLILEFRPTFPKEWGSRCAFAWIRVEGVTQNMVDKINRWKYRVKPSFFSAEQKAFWKAAKEIHQEHREDVARYVKQAARVFVATHHRQPTRKEVEEFGADKEHAGRTPALQKIKQRLKQFLLPPVAVADLLPHVEQTPEAVWKPEPTMFP